RDVIRPQGHHDQQQDDDAGDRQICARAERIAGTTSGDVAGADCHRWRLCTRRAGACILPPTWGMQRVERSIRVKAPTAQVYQFWRNFENFPRFMEHVEEVRCQSSDCRQSHWKLHGPMGQNVEYDADLTQDEPNRAIGWNS